MQRYKYVHVVTGEVEAPNEDNARNQVLMAVTLSSRLHQTPLQVALELVRLEAQPNKNGSSEREVGMEH